LKSFAGRLIGPEDADYDEARKVYNAMIDKRPALIARCANAADVAQAVRFARDHDLLLAIRGGGHNGAGLGTVDDGVVIDLSLLKGVDVDPKARTARVAGGSVWGEVDAATNPHGLATPSGIISTTGVGGLTLGGGLGWLVRKHGLACDNLRSADVVTADGELVRADRRQNTDLFWAIRGGGGAFGVITALEIELFDLPTVYAGAAFFPIERAAEVLHTWRELTEKVDDRTTTVGRILRVPPFPEIPEPFRGKHFAMVEVIHIGDQRSGDEVVKGIRDLEPAIDTFGLIPTSALIHLHMDPPGPVPGKGEHHVAMATLPAEAIDAFVAVNGADSGSDILTAEIRHLGGAIARPDASHGAAYIDAEYISFAASMAASPDMAEKAEHDLARLDEALSPYQSARKYLNFTEVASRPGEFFEKSTLDRLRAVKTQVDPEGIFRSNQPID
jgi:FAD/FMN-containing dehydrogenase